MMDPLHLPPEVRARASRIEALLAPELVWFARAFAWALLGSAIVSYVYLFRLGPRFLEDSDAPVRRFIRKRSDLVRASDAA